MLHIYAVCSFGQETLVMRVANMHHRCFHLFPKLDCAFFPTFFWQNALVLVRCIFCGKSNKCKDHKPLYEMKLRFVCKVCDNVGCNVHRRSSWPTCGTCVTMPLVGNTFYRRCGSNDYTGEEGLGGGGADFYCFVYAYTYTIYIYYIYGACGWRWPLHAYTIGRRKGAAVCLSSTAVGRSSSPPLIG